jgi:hypothetical protein
MRKKLRGFRQWCTVTQQAREVEDGAQQAKLLVYAKDQRSLRETQLEQQLHAEAAKAAAVAAKCDAMASALAAAEAKVAQLSLAASSSGVRTADAEALRKEQEKVVIANAKLNTFKAKADKEIAELTEQLRQHGARYAIFKL